MIFATTTFAATSAQVSNLRSKKINTSVTTKLDSLSIVPGTFFIAGYDTSFYRVDYVNADLYWKKKLSQDSVSIQYRVFSFKLNAVAKRYSYDSIRNYFIAQQNNAAKTTNPIFNFGNLTYNGSFGRSLSFGNTQDAVFNSQFDLQINGMLGDSIMLSAAITDNNIPIQPDGTTEQLNEFDKILLQFKKKYWEVDLGDIDLRQTQSYFLNFYTRLDGISYQQQFNITKNIVDKALVTGAVSKGKFAENIVAVQEGNQGPYKLQGNNNELYFIVLANTERVFINGVQMQRGQDQDYVINYNTAEVTFTPKRLISSDTRVEVDFEYADRNYLNSLLYASNETDFGKKFILNFSAYSNTDAKNSPISQPLDAQQEQFLANLGDSVQNAFYKTPAAAVDSFDATQIMYKKIDTVVNGVHDSIYVYSTSPDSAKYNLQFVNVGQNKGDYIPSYNLANGNVYQWVPPVNGIPQGSYDAAVFLVTPKKHQVFTLGGTYFLDNKTTIKTELASSNYDVNTFSTLDKENDVGYATKIGIDRKNSWQTSTKKFTMDINAGYEYEDENFQPVERIHPVEFLRDWGLDLTTTTTVKEQLPSFSFSLSDDKMNSIQYVFTSYIRSDGYVGYRNVIQHTQAFQGFHLTDVFNLTNISLPGDKGYFLRPTIDINKTFASLNNYTIGATYEVEHNEIRNIASDTVSALSFAYETVAAYIKSNTANPNHWSFNYYSRSDQLPFQKNLVQADHSNNFTFQTELLKNPHQQFRLNLTYRNLQVSDTTLTTQRPDNSLLGRAEYVTNVLNGFIIGNSLFELGAGQEQKRDFTYIEVPAGQGQYTWIDYNKDGIAQLNEFVLALFPDQATYIRIFTPTNQYVKAEYNQFNYSVVINPKAITDKISSKKLRNFLSRFILQSSLQTGKKVQAQNTPLFNPFKGKIQDTSLIDLNYKMSNTLSFNRTNSNWGADLSDVTNYDKSLLTYGLQTQQTDLWTLKGRVNIKRTYTLQLQQQLGNTGLFTPSFGDQNYAIKSYDAQPSLTYLNSTKFRLQGGYEFLSKTNAAQYGGETAVSNSFNFEADYNAVQRTSFTAKFTFSNIDFTGTQNTTVSYIMLNGLLPGKNYIINLNLTKRLVNNLELSFEYEGRKSATSQMVNIGRASLRALL